jgi:hypothetical protein
MIVARHRAHQRSADHFWSCNLHRTRRAGQSWVSGGMSERDIIDISKHQNHTRDFDVAQRPNREQSLDLH